MMKPSFMIEEIGLLDLSNIDRSSFNSSHASLECLIDTWFVTVTVGDLTIRVMENFNNSPGMITIETEGSLEILPSGPNVIRLRKRREEG